MVDEWPLSELHIELEPEVRWEDVAPLLQELQDQDKVVFASIRRSCMRPGAGGPGFDILPILITVLIVTPAATMVQDVVRSVVYPFLRDARDRLYVLYSRLPIVKPPGAVKPLAIRLEHDHLTALYRLPDGLTREQFSLALAGLPKHFESIKTRGAASLMFDFHPTSGQWVENVEAGEFLTWVQKRREAQEPGTPIHTEPKE